MSETELSPQQRALVAAAVKETFLSLGLDIENSDGITEAQKDFLHLRQWRKTVETAKSQGLIVTVGTLITGAIALFILGIRQVFGGGP